MKLEYIILGLLSWRSIDGYEIVKWLDSEGQFLRSRIHHSQVYRELGKMVTSGWVTFETDRRDGRPDAKVYSLTDIGRAALVDWVHSPYDPPSRFQDVDFMVRFSFAVGIDLEAAQAIVATELTYRKAQVALNRGRDKTMWFSDNSSVDRDLTRDIHVFLDEFGMRSIDTWIEWLEALQTKLAGYSLAEEVSK